MGLWEGNGGRAWSSLEFLARSRWGFALFFGRAPGFLMAGSFRGKGEGGRTGIVLEKQRASERNAEKAKMLSSTQERRENEKKLWVLIFFSFKASFSSP